MGDRPCFGAPSGVLRLVARAHLAPHTSRLTPRASHLAPHTSRLVRTHAHSYDCVAYCSIALAGNAAARGSSESGGESARRSGGIIPSALSTRFFKRMTDGQLVEHISALLRVAHQILPHVPAREQGAIVETIDAMWRTSKSGSPAKRLCVHALHK